MTRNFHQRLTWSRVYNVFLSHKLNWNFLFHFILCSRVARRNNSEWNETISTCRHIFSLISFTSLLHFFAFVVINFTKCLHNISFHTLLLFVDVVSTLNSNDISSNLLHWEDFIDKTEETFHIKISSNDPATHADVVVCSATTISPISDGENEKHFLRYISNIPDRWYAFCCQ